MQGPLVSIVMPVYNAEKYIEETLFSLKMQTYHNFEVICVDDGSSDESLSILKKWANNDSRIKILTQKNQYAGVARNNGLAVESGKYILFLDSDDIFEKNMLTFLVKKAEEYDTDIIFFDYYSFSGEKKKEYHKSPAKVRGVPLNKVISPQSICKDLFFVDYGMPWNKFLKTEFVKEKKVEFQALKNTNDECFSRTISVEAKRILFSDERLVAYRVNNTSSLQGSVNKSATDFLQAMVGIHDELRNRGYYEQYYSAYQQFVAYSIMVRLDSKNDFETFERVAKELMERTFEQCEIDCDYVPDEYKLVYEALKEKNLAKAAFEMNMMRKRVITNSRAMKISAQLRRLIRI